MTEFTIRLADERGAVDAAAGERMERAWDAAGDDPKAFISTGVTYAGHPVACAAGLAVLDIVEKENLPENARVQGDYLLKRLQHFGNKYRSVGEVRGKGLMIAIDLVRNKQTRESVDPTHGFAHQIAKVGRDNGIMVRPYGPKIILSPPLIFSAQHCNDLTEALEKTLSELDS